MSPERVLVTGGAGFIGSHIVDALVAQGHTVSVVDNLVKGKRENVNPAARFHQVDIRAADEVRRVFSAERPQVIVHQAALADVRASVVDPAGYAITNIVGTLNLLEAARTVGGVRKFIFASTGGAVYGDPAELPATEQCPAARSTHTARASWRANTTSPPTITTMGWTTACCATPTSTARGRIRRERRGSSPSSRARCCAASPR